jgi:hypothetical protein
MLYLWHNLNSIFSVFLNLVSSKLRKPSVFQVGMANKYFETDTTKFVYTVNNSDSYFADPFIFQLNSIKYVFCEKYLKISKKGVIVVFQVSEENKLIDLGVALEEDFHLSFPFIFEFKKNIYMVPESKSAEKVFLYKNITWPDKWQQISVILEGSKAVDSVVFRHDEIWWLLTTFDGAGTSMSQSELHVYFSPELESGNWEKHPKNPVIIDSYKGRNAGFFMDRKRLIRCSQSMQDYQYGRKLNFHEITKLTIFEYLETDLDLGNFSYSHSYDTKYGISVIDTRF